MARAKTLPKNVRAWIDTLVFQAKIDYAQTYALAIINEQEHPADPGTPWATKTRKRVDTLLGVKTVSTSKASKTSTKATKADELSKATRERANKAFAQVFSEAPEGHKRRAAGKAFRFVAEGQSVPKAVAAALATIDA